MNGRSHPFSISTSIRSVRQEFSCPIWFMAFEAADIDRNIQLLIRNLVEIKDTSGEFLLRLDDGRVIDTKGWNDWEWTHGVGLYGICKYYQQTRDARCREIMLNWFRDRFAAGTPTKNINTVAPFLTLAYLYEESPEQLLAALSRRVGRVAHGRPAAHRGERLPAHRVQFREPRSSSGTTRS